MPAPRTDIQPFIDRLLNDAGAAFVDETFARAFNRLGPTLRQEIMARITWVRREPDARARLAPDNDINVDAFHTEEENNRAERVAQMRRDMAREIDGYRTRRWEHYEHLPAHQQTMGIFQAWSRDIEEGSSNIRSRWEARIAQENRGPVPPQERVRWPNPADYEPGGRYQSVRGALGAYTREVNVVYGTRVAGGAWEEERDRIHINGTMAIRRVWNYVPVSETARRANIGAHGAVLREQLSPRIPDPPPTTTPWPAPEPEVDELDIMLKHLPRNGRCALVTATSEAAVEIQQKVNNRYNLNNEAYFFLVSALARDTALLRAIKNLALPVFIDPSVFKMHAKREGDWSEADLDRLIELQGEIPDEETT